MLDKKTLAKYLDQLKENLKKLNSLKSIKKEDFLSDWKSQGLVERQLQVSIECLLNTGEILISGLDFRKPESFKDIIKVLVENRVLTSALGEKLEELAGFRNVLVHDYLYLDLKKVYGHLHKDIKYFEEFLKQVKKFVARI